MPKYATAANAYGGSHCGNLGIEAKFRARIAPRTTEDEVAFDLYDTLKVICGNTKWLPRRINIGPDRVIYALNGTLALRMLNGRPPVSALTRAGSIDEARNEMIAWRDENAKRGRHGPAACTRGKFRILPRSPAGPALPDRAHRQRHVRVLRPGPPVGQISAAHPAVNAARRVVRRGLRC